MDDGHHGDPVRYEKTDADARSTVRAIAALAVITAVTIAVLIPMFGFLQTYVGRDDAPTTPVSRFETGRRPPKPWLQEQPFKDLQELRAHEAVLLGQYAWADRAQGVIRMPIDDAMAVVVERGLPVREPAAVAVAAAPAASPARSTP